MSACRTDNEYFELSELDALGAEMMYPHDFSRKLVVRNAFSNGDGSRYIARRNMLFELIPDWLARGASSSAFNSVTWRVNGQIFGFGNLAQGITFTTEADRVITVSLVDMRSRTHDGQPSITADVNDSKHTAVVMSVHRVLRCPESRLYQFPFVRRCSRPS